MPPLFQVVQLHEIEYIYKIEGKGAVKLALDADGNLWMWDHQIAGLTGLVFYFYPVISFIAGLLAIVVIKGIYSSGGQTRVDRLYSKGKS